MSKPRLTFYCELDEASLTDLFNSFDISELPQASISLGIIDLSPGRAEVVQRLNRAGIPVIAWLLLPKQEGYWFNVDNAPQAAARYQSFKEWSTANGLVWDRVGLDIEPDFRELQGLLKRQWQVIPSIAGRLLNGRRLRQARQNYRALVDRIRADGYPVDTYQIPFIVDERLMRSKLLQKAAGIIDLPSDREVLMAYSSFLRPNGPGFVWSYARQAQSIGVGVTGGGVDPEGMNIRPLSWDELARDLRLAWVFVDDIHIFSLEGCVQQGFLRRLKNFQWDVPIFDPVDQFEKVDRIRYSAQTALWLTSKAWIILPLSLALAYLFNRLRKQDR